MHDRQRIRNGIRDRLLAQVGTLVPGGIHAGRARGIVADGKVPAILVDVFKATGDIFDDQAQTEVVTYLAEVCLVGDGPEPDLADGERPCCDELDDLCVEVRRALKRDWALSGGLRMPGPAHLGPNRLTDWRFLDEALAVQPGGKGAVAHLTHRFAVNVVCDDGTPAYA